MMQVRYYAELTTRLAAWQAVASQRSVSKLKARQASHNLRYVMALAGRQCDDSRGAGAASHSTLRAQTTRGAATYGKYHRDGLMLVIKSLLKLFQFFLLLHCSVVWLNANCSSSCFLLQHIACGQAVLCNSSEQYLSRLRV